VAALHSITELACDNNIEGKGKGTVRPRTGHEGPEGE